MTDSPPPLPSELGKAVGRRVLIILDPVRYPEPLFTQTIEKQLLEFSRSKGCKLQDLRLFLLSDSLTLQALKIGTELKIPTFNTESNENFESYSPETLKATCDSFGKVIVVLSADNSETADFVRNYQRSYESGNQGPVMWACLIPPCRKSLR